jgi:hypothetical protein
MSFQPRFLATGVGSMPFEDPAYAVGISLSKMPAAPFWPQLPRLGLTEQMEIQYSEGMPRIVIDEEKGRMYFDTSGDYSEALAEFYETYMLAMDPDDGSGDCSALAISPEFSKGIYAFEEQLRSEGGTRPFVKVHTTGPCSFALTTVDENKRASYYNEEFRDVVVKALAMKCRWQIQKFQPFAERVICFVDEPILAAFGSSTYVAVNRDAVVALLSEVIEAVHADDAVAGVHCCGNTDWSMAVDSRADIVNFDAFELGDVIAMYADSVQTLFDRGGMLAWGVVPTSLQIREQSVESMVDRLEALMDGLAGRGIDKQLIAERAMITPACGTGTMAPADAEKVFQITAELSETMQKRYGF